MKHKRASLVFICSLLLPLPAAADNYGAMFGVMFRMMLTMANVMSSAMDSSNSWNSWSSPFNSFGSGWNSWSSPFNSLGSGWNSWPAMGSLAGLGVLPGMYPWSGMGGWPGTGVSPWSLPPGGGPWGSPLAGGYNPATLSGPGGIPPAGGLPGWPGGWNGIPGGGYGVSPLDGQWYGNTGEVLKIRGNRFQLSNGWYRVQGVLEVGNNLVRMFTPQTGSLQVYTFVRNQTGLVLQDTSGQVLVFQQNPFPGMVHVF
jgi:hypothetical protein